MKILTSPSEEREELNEYYIDRLERVRGILELLIVNLDPVGTDADLLYGAFSAVDVGKTAKILVREARTFVAKVTTTLGRHE